MYISRLALDHFRSWDHCLVDFHPGINIMQGRNGLGKTNIVEAIEVMSTGASHRVHGTVPLIERGNSSATIRMNVHDTVQDEERASMTHITTYEATLAKHGANRARVNGGSSGYFRDIVGRTPSVTFAPEDQHLVLGDPADRRGFLDQAGVLLIPEYSMWLQTFRKTAKQRAALLKQLSEHENNADTAVMSGLETWTGQFIAAGLKLTEMRLNLCDSLNTRFTELYSTLSDSPEKACVSYLPSFSEIHESDDVRNSISEHFQRIFPGEIVRGQNLIGPHRDDLDFLLDDARAREYASNGEMWTMALALKMALFGLIREVERVEPVVILDDVFAQLDETRRGQILDFAGRPEQVLITVAAQGDIPETDVANRIDVAALLESDSEGL